MNTVFICLGEYSIEFKNPTYVDSRGSIALMAYGM